MGYCTRVNPGTGREQFVCDACGRAGGVRRRRCPFGYCYPPAFCDDCHKAHAWGRKATHRERGCDVRHAEFVADRERAAASIAAGVPVRCSALAAGTPEEPGRVHVLFQTTGGTVGRYMPKAVYDAHPLGVTVTLADYEATHGGELPEAPAEFYFGGTSKQLRAAAT